MSVKGDLWKDGNKGEREGLQDDRHRCYDVWFGGSDKREAELKILRFTGSAE